MDPVSPGKAASAAAKAPPPGKPTTTLLDVYEVEWITRELNRLLVRESGAGEDGRRRRRHRHHHGWRLAKASLAGAGAAPKPDADGAKKGGFLTELLGRHAVSICGGDAVDAGSGGRRRGAGGSFREVEKVPW